MQEEASFDRRMMYRLMCALLVVLVANAFMVVGGGFFVWYLTNEIKL